MIFLVRATAQESCNLDHFIDLTQDFQLVEIIHDNLVFQGDKFMKMKSDYLDPIIEVELNFRLAGISDSFQILSNYIYESESTFYNQIITEKLFEKAFGIFNTINTSKISLHENENILFLFDCFGNFIMNASTFMHDYNEFDPYFKVINIVKLIFETIRPPFPTQIISNNEGLHESIIFALFKTFNHLFESEEAIFIYLDDK